MTTVNGTNTATSTAGSKTASDTRKATMNYDSFLRLLVAEMKFQDPTQPKDSSQYMTQLAQFSNVEQAVNMNSKLDSMMASLAMSEANSFIGRTVTSADGKISGIVKSVEISNTGSIATLEDGRKLTIQSGVTVSKS